MPKNKEALMRYRVINRCLTERKSVTKVELIEACERALDICPIGERTIDADIHEMRYDERLGYHAPIKFDRNSKKYYYADPDYSIDNIPLNEEELDSIMFAARMLDQFKGVEILETFMGSVRKLVDAVNVYRNYGLDTFRNFIEFEKVDEAKGTEFIEPIIEALKNKIVIEIEYRSFTSKEITSHVIHPYLLKEYRNRWYLVGYHNSHKAIRTYGLDRIIKISQEPGIRFFDSKFNAREYYKNVIGVSVLNQKPFEIQIAFSELQAQYLMTQPLHHSQELVAEKEGRFVFKFFLVPNYEFISQVLAWGDEVEVLMPDAFKRKVEDTIRNIVIKYK